MHHNRNLPMAFPWLRAKGASYNRFDLLYVPRLNVVPSSIPTAGTPTEAIELEIRGAHHVLKIHAGRNLKFYRLRNWMGSPAQALSHRRWHGRLNRDGDGSLSLRSGCETRERRSQLPVCEIAFSKYRKDSRHFLGHNCSAMIRRR